ncbi:MAG: N-acetylmuramoyl-L-alanine amidase [Lachnospiraceae bacterium]|nr:N-acetylmuramoyl-L-alanine amidase [Lachnospiraceae bacterium]
MRGKSGVFMIILSLVLFAGGITLMAGSVDMPKSADEIPALLKAHKQAFYPQTKQETVTVIDATEPPVAEAAQAGSSDQADGVVNESAGDPSNADTKASDEDAETTEDRIEELASLREKYDRIVVLDPGHGGNDKGISVKLSDDPGQVINEKDVTLDIAKKAAELLEEEGIYVVMTRDDDTSLSNEERAQIANMIPADIFVSIHMMRDDDSEKYGVSAYYNDEFYSESILGGELAYLILDETASEGKQKAQGIYSINDNTSAVRLLMIPGMEISAGWLSNAQDARLVGHEEYRQKIASGIAKGIVKAFLQMDR